MRTFRDSLREALKLAESAIPSGAEHLRRWLDSPDSAEYLFRPSDAEHLRRWLSNKQAIAIFAKLTKGKEITQARVADHILLVVALRRFAETSDRFNARFVKLKREGPPLVKKAHRHAMVQFADGKISQEELDAYIADINQTESDLIRSLVPPVVVRSDKCGSRKRTIFCRLLSRVCLRTTGRWHDAEVAALCGIAFDCDVAIETVKDARKFWAGSIKAPSKRNSLVVR